MADELSMADVAAPSANGVSHVEKQRGRFDEARRVFVTVSGAELGFKAIPPLILERLLSESERGKPKPPLVEPGSLDDEPTYKDKPKPPMVEVTIGGKHKVMQAHPNDVDYQAQLAAWTKEQQFLIFRYLFSAGIAVAVPADFEADHREFFPNVSTAYMKYLYVASLIPDDEDLVVLSQLIMGQTIPTQAGLEDAAATFPSEYERQPD